MEPQNGAGLIIVRMWIDKQPSNPLRARITYVPDVSQDDKSVVWRQSSGAIATEIDRILEDFLNKRGPT